MPPYLKLKFNNIPPENFKETRQEKIFYHFCVLTVIFIFFYLHYMFLSPRTELMQDEALYALYANNIHQSLSYLFAPQLWQFHPPLFSILLQPGYFFEPPETGFRVVSLVISLLGIYSVFLLGQKIGGNFLGTFAAIFLAFSQVYFIGALMINTDTILMTGLIILGVSMLSLRTDKNNKPAEIMIFLSGIICMYVKWGGLLVIPVLIVSHYAKYAGLNFSDSFKIIRRPFLLVLFSLVTLLLFNFLLTGEIISKPSFLTYLNGAYYKYSYLSTVTALKDLFHSPILTISFMFGIFLPLLSKRDDDRVLVSVFLIVLILVSLCAEKTMRYTLLVIPFCILITGRTIQYFIHLFFRNNSVLLRKSQAIIIVVMFGLSATLLPYEILALSDLSSSFKGLKKIGQWLTNRTSKNTIILASSVRQIQYYSGLTRSEEGGNLYYFSPNLDDSLKIIKSHKGECLIVLDSWEPQQPVDLLDSGDMAVFTNMGFNQEKRLGPFFDMTEIPKYIAVYTRK